MRFTLRSWIWVIGLATVAVVGAWSVLRHADLGLVLLLCLVAVGVVGLVAEMTNLVAARRGTKARRLPPTAAPADGRVELIAVRGAVGEPNAVNSQLRRFAALEPCPCAVARPAERHTPILLGRVAIASLFLGRYRQHWSDAEIARAYESLERAGAWIEREAMRWKASLNIALSDLYFSALDENADDVEVAFVLEGDHEALFEAHASTHALAAFSRAARQLGFADAEQLITEVNGRLDADAWVWLIHARSAGRSLAIPAADTVWPGVTMALCYAREAAFPEPLIEPPRADAVTYAHELLHLFGASDKYQYPLHSYPRGAVTDRDIMCLYHETLLRLRVDPLTAAEIGWADAPG